MLSLDVVKLAERVNAESLLGSVASQLLIQGNCLYESSQSPDKLKRICPNGEISEGYFRGDDFVIERIFASPLKR
ncbi:hypothetical protein AVL55_11890 [Alteromonas macleodii]|uniref:Uncharacterized protein n=1 Tax=Alteromonas macleodii TaxID=28108 RepID=A0A126Q0G4_ALTMA|nr:hypothetical protein [Alteromonas macleodii]AMJ98806.1 hypothetical protein AVL55_11890 [Alteromonas macleodii]|tara:strand:+ start:82 stop:306 length:225 start_codon:yes stop_codon:yes gene_type:complete